MNKKTKRRDGEGCFTPNGYFQRHVAGKYQLEHIRVAEKALGKRLPKGAIVHHVDLDKLNNAPTNLVICPSGSYHKLIHQRLNALASCGHVDWRKCSFCQIYDKPENLFINQSNVHHRACKNAYVRALRKESVNE